MIELIEGKGRTIIFGFVHSSRYESLFYNNPRRRSGTGEY